MLSYYTSDEGMVAFAALSFAMALFGFLAMPETKGKWMDTLYG